MFSHRGPRAIPRGTGDAGFTLVEIVVAASILFITAMAVMTAISFGALSTSQAATRARSLDVANQVLEQARNLPFDSVGIQYADGSYGDPSGSIPATTTIDGLSVQTEVSWARDPVTLRHTYKNIKITVSWTSPISSSVSVDSAVYGKSDITNIGDLKVAVKEYGTANPIPAAQVYATPAGGTSQRVVWTDAAGESFFGALPIGRTPVRVTATGWVFDDSQLTTCTVGPDLLTSVVAWGYRPCTAAVTVIDTSGTPIPSSTVTITDSKGRARTLTTLADGLATFTSLLPDIWSVSVSAPSRAGATGALGPMVSGGVYSLTITLTQAVPPGALTVRVHTMTGTDISGATVAVTDAGAAHIPGSPKATATNGEAPFASVPTGTYTITVTKDGYHRTTASADVVSNVTKVVEVGMPAYVPAVGAIRVHLANSNGSDRNNATVYVYDAGGHFVASDQTDHHGYVTFSDLLVGSYTVSADRAASKPAVVTDGGTADVELVRS
jgi:type II secretory pathway pseudopilin PulG